MSETTEDEPVDHVDPVDDGEVVRLDHLDHDVIRAIEAIVMVATEPVTPAVLAPLLGLGASAIDALCRRLAETYEESGAGFQLLKVAGGWRFQSHPDLAAYVERFVLEGQSARMSAAALETLAIVAYKQPISRAQIASIRGVDPDAVLRTLQLRGYVDQIGRDPGPGQAVLWGTTPIFLEKLGLASLADLPPLAEFVPGADVVEALEQGLRVAPIDGPTPEAVTVAERAAADERAPSPADDGLDVEPDQLGGAGPGASSVDLADTAGSNDS
jgi:segregation and condensation protein B